MTRHARSLGWAAMLLGVLTAGVGCIGGYTDIKPTDHGTYVITRVGLFDTELLECRPADTKTLECARIGR